MSLGFDTNSSIGFWLSHLKINLCPVRVGFLLWHLDDQSLVSRAALLHPSTVFSLAIPLGAMLRLGYILVQFYVHNAKAVEWTLLISSMANLKLENHVGFVEAKRIFYAEIAMVLVSWAVLWALLMNRTWARSTKFKSLLWINCIQMIDMYSVYRYMVVSGGVYMDIFTIMQYDFTIRSGGNEYSLAN